MVGPSLAEIPMHQRIRCVLLPLLLTALFCPSIYQPLLDYTWSTLRRTTTYNWSTFETIWTVLWYFVIEGFMTFTFMKRPEWRYSYNSDNPKSWGRVKGMRRLSRRMGEIATYIVPLLIMDLTMIKKFADVKLTDILESGGYHDYHHLQNFDVEQSSTVYNNSTGASISPPKTFLVPTLHNFTLSAPLQLHRALPLHAPTSRRLVTELILSFVIYDFLFFLFHLSLHQVPLLRTLHIPHHSHPAQVNPQITNHLSISERLGLVMLANFSLNIIGAHVLTRTVFVVVFVWLLVEIHCGMDVTWGYDKVLPTGWGGGARKHMRHHVDGSGGLAPFFGWCDAGLERFMGVGLGKTGRKRKVY